MLVINSVPASGDTADMELPPLKFHRVPQQTMMSNFDHRVEIWFARLDRVICRHRIVRVRGLAKGLRLASQGKLYLRQALLGIAITSGFQQRIRRAALSPAGPAAGENHEA